MQVQPTVVIEITTGNAHAVARVKQSEGRRLIAESSGLIAIVAILAEVIGHVEILVTILVEVLLAVVGGGRAVVVDVEDTVTIDVIGARVADPIVIRVQLLRVRCLGAVVLLVADLVAVPILIAGVADAIPIFVLLIAIGGSRAVVAG